MKSETGMAKPGKNADTAAKVFRTLEQQIDLLFALPRTMAAAGLESDNSVVLALLGMIEATARRRIGDMSNPTPTLPVPGLRLFGVTSLDEAKR